MTATAPYTSPLMTAATGLHATVTKKALTGALALLERIIPTRSSNPALLNLRVDATEAGLRLSGTNLELDLECFIAADVQAPESFTVPAHLFGQLVRTLGSELVTLSLEGSELHVHAGGTSLSLQTGDLQAHPALAFPNHADLSLDAAELARALGSVRYAASNEAFQAVFRGIKLEHHAGFARVVASDGYRVALRDFPVEGTGGRNLIIPARSVDELTRVLKDGQARFTYGEGMLTVTTEQIRMNLKLLDGEYPEYERVIPKDIRLQFTLPAVTLKEAVGRVAVLADKNANNRVEFLVSEGKLRLSAEGDYGRAQDTVEVQQGGREPAMSLAFNARHVLDALGPVEGDVTLRLSGASTPGILQPADGSAYQAIIVTLRV